MVHLFQILLPASLTCQILDLKCIAIMLSYMASYNQNIVIHLWLAKASHVAVALCPCKKRHTLQINDLPVDQYSQGKVLIPNIKLDLCSPRLQAVFSFFRAQMWQKVVDKRKSHTQVILQINFMYDVHIFKNKKFCAKLNWTIGHFKPRI